MSNNRFFITVSPVCGEFNINEALRNFASSLEGVPHEAEYEPTGQRRMTKITMTFDSFVPFNKAVVACQIILQKDGLRPLKYKSYGTVGEFHSGREHSAYYQMTWGKVQA